ncbi:MAG: hypothetical protein IJD67_00965 [Clostridia bacterium]|nr:hypothetical protein [Clostridia bacterium]
MKKITYLYMDGRISKEYPLNKSSIMECHGMKIKCILIDGSEHIGFANPYYSFEKGAITLDPQELDYITLETFANLDEETHTFVGDKEHQFDINREVIPISLISHIDAILFSALRWGNPPTNKFNLKINP